MLLLPPKAVQKVQDDKHWLIITWHIGFIKQLIEVCILLPKGC